MQAVIHPLAAPLIFQQATAAQLRQVAGNFRLAVCQCGGQLADAQFAFSGDQQGHTGAGFIGLEYSPKKIYWGGCTPKSVSIRAEVEDPDEVFSVIIFVRVKDIQEEDSTPWTSGAIMLDRGQGEFTYNMIGSKIYGHDHYLRSWIYFQLVATNIEGEEIGRTRVYEKAVDMYPCPCLTPLTGCPIVTPKP